MVVSWDNWNKPSCWHVVASLSPGDDIGHVRAEPAAKGRRAFRVQCREGCCCHCRDTDIFEQTGMHVLKTIEQHFDLDSAKSATYYSEKIPLDNCLLAFEAIADKAKDGSSQILNMRAQCILHSVVAIGRMTYKSDRGIFSYLPPSSPGFIHKIFQEMCDEAAKLRCGAARALAPIVELHEASRIPIVEFYSGFVVGELEECMDIIPMNPPSACLMAKGSRLVSWKPCPSWT